MIFVSLPMSVFADEIDKITSINKDIYVEKNVNEECNKRLKIQHYTN